MNAGQQRIQLESRKKHVFQMIVDMHTHINRSTLAKVKAHDLELNLFYS